MRKLGRGGGAAVATLIGMLIVCAFTGPGREPAARHSASRLGTSRVAASRLGPFRVGGPMVAAAGWARPGPMVAAAGLGRAGPMVAGRTIVVHSLNWAGYAAARAGMAFHSVGASFFVPYLDCLSTPGSYSSHWVGLDGLASSSVEQLGVAAGCAGSQPQYYAWYEMYPKPVSGVFPVKPGNAIMVSVSYEKRHRRFILTFHDLTTGRHFSRTEKCAAKACPRSSAEVISEAPSDMSGQILPLANYRAVSFSGSTLVSAAGHRGGLSSRWWNTYRITGVGQSSRGVIQQPTSLFRGQAFTNYWIRES